MHVRLVSDFTDYYDHHFDREGDVEFRRVTTEGPSRSKMFTLFNGHALAYPRYGWIGHWDIPDSTWVVVYLDERAHRGEGKDVMRMREARERFLGALAAVAIDTGGNRPTSLRYLRAGALGMWLRYRSDDAWRSNCGDVEVTRTDPPPEAKTMSLDFRQPLYAVDFVRGIDGVLYAVDYNVAPGCSDCVKLSMPAEEVAGQIKAWIMVHPGYGTAERGHYA